MRSALLNCSFEEWEETSYGILHSTFYVQNESEDICIYKYDEGITLIRYISIYRDYIDNNIIKRNWNADVRISDEFSSP